MRGDDKQQMSVFSYVNAEQRVPSDHPLRAIRQMTDAALAGVSEHFDAARRGRPAVVAGESWCGRCCCKRCFSSAQRAAVDGAVGLQPAVPLVRWAEHGRRDLGRDGVHQVPGAAAARRSGGTVVTGRRRTGACPAAVERRAFHGGRDSDPGLGEPAQLPGEGRRRTRRTRAPGRRAGEITLGADKGYQEERFIGHLRHRRVVPHVAEYDPNPQWPSFLTEAERSGAGFATSQRKRKLVEKVFGWAKLDRAIRQVKLRGLRRVGWLFQLVATAHNLRRMQKLLATP